MPAREREYDAYSGRSRRECDESKYDTHEDMGRDRDTCDEYDRSNDLQILANEKGSNAHERDVLVGD
ncbi:hypothetical protein GCM10020258_60120 [Sphingomonas yabuuchiae]